MSQQSPEPGPPVGPPAGPPPPPPGGWPANPYAPTPGPASPPEPRRDRGLAWTGLVLAFIVCLPIVPLAGAVVGVVVLVRGRAPKWFGIVALVVGLGVTALQVGAVAASWSDVRDGIQDGLQEGIDQETGEARESGEATEVSPLGLEPGDCFDDPAIRGITGDDEVESLTVTLQPCDAAHDLEVFAALEVEGEDFPGQEEVGKTVERCFPRFESFVGTPYADSALELYYYFPTERSWTLLGDRTVTCLVGDPQQKVSGTLEGARR